MKKVLIVLIIVLSFALVGCKKENTTTTISKDRDTTTELINYTVNKGVKYASSSTNEVMDIYVPNELNTNMPAVVLVHGGAFAVGDEGMFSSTAKWLANHGVVVACISYRVISKNGTFPNAIGDVKAAVRFIRKNAKNYQVNPDELVLWGESAGAYLSVMAGVTGGTSACDADVSDNLDISSSVKVIVDFYGPISVKEFQDQGLMNFIGVKKEDIVNSENAEKIAASDPTSYISSYTPDNSPYFIIEHGDSDTTVSNKESIYLRDKLLPKVGESKIFFKTMAGCHHMDNSFYTDANLSEVLELINDYFKV